MNFVASSPEARERRRASECRWSALGLALALAAAPVAAAPYGPERRCESALPEQLDLHVKEKHLKRFREPTRLGDAAKAIPVTLGTAEDRGAARGKLTPFAESRDAEGAFSYRISLSRDEPAFGMFEMRLIPALRGRDDARTAVFAALCSEGIVVPRTTTIPGSLNRSPLGDLHLIETPGKEMLEHRQRREGVLLRLERRSGAAHTVRLVPLDRAAVLRSDERSSQFDVARALAQGFFRRELPAASVFDVDVMARFLAVAATSDAAALVALPNLRFYFDPITLLLEPVAFDGEVVTRPAATRKTPTAAWFARSPWVSRLLEDPALRAAVDAHVERLTGRATVARDGANSRPQDADALLLEGSVRLTAHPLPSASRDEALATHPFLRWDAERETFTVRPGVWRVEGSLILPPGAGLEIPGGTTLRFPEGGMLLASGPLRFSGSAARPVVLEGTTSPFGARGWQGLVVLRSARPHHWTGVRVRHTRGIERGPWRLTGGVTFRESNVRIEDSTFEANRAEDALNLIHTTFELVRVSVLDTPSDALDTDFSFGQIQGGRFSGVGGDGIDVSGSLVDVRGTALASVGDKAISVGEGSRLRAHEVSIRDVGAALACKDASHAIVEDSRLAEIHHATLMAYVKKPEYGPATINAARLEIDSPREAVAQIGSRIVLDGVPVEPSHVDADELYRAGFMKK